ncbi:hypothetical protein KQH54_04130 [bacterium]|nr:hypothetical protein [bacterium]
MKKFILIVTFLLVVVLAGCQSNTPVVEETSAETGVVPADFHMILDVVSNYYPESHLYMELNADGGLKYARYENGGTIEYSSDGMIAVPGEDALERGLFNLDDIAMGKIWALIQDEGLFDLKDDYRMEIGDSFAFIAITGDGQTNIIDNIGMDLPQAEALVNLINSFLPEVVWGAY